MPLLKVFLFSILFPMTTSAQEMKLVEIVSNKSPVELELLIDQINKAYVQGYISEEDKESYLINLNRMELALKKIATKNTLLIIKSQILKEVINLGQSLSFKSNINSLHIRRAQKGLKETEYLPFGRYIIHYAIKDFDQLMSTGLIDKMKKKRLSVKERKIVDNENRKLKFISPLIHHFLSLNSTDFNKFYTSFSLKIIERLSVILGMVSKISFESQIAENETLVHFVIKEAAEKSSAVENKETAPLEKEEKNGKIPLEELPKINSEKIIDQIIEEKISEENPQAPNPENKQNWAPKEENNSSKNPKNNWVPK